MSTILVRSYSRITVFFSTVLLVCTLGLALPAPMLVSKLKPLSKHTYSTHLIIDIINNSHYRKKALNDALSSAIYDRYLERLDPDRNIFHQADIREFSRYRWKLDDHLRRSDLTPAFEMYNRFRQRVAERARYALGLIAKRKFNFRVKEKYRFDRSNVPWPKTRAELDRLWYKRVKNDFLNLKLAGKKIKDIRVTLRKRYERLERRNKQSKPEDVYQLFMNAYTLSIEPHTSYFSPRVSEDFKIHMSLSLEGIGAALGVENEFTVIRRIIPGGPAAQSGKLKKDDRIIGVGQGKFGKIVDVVGQRLDDVVRLIRGPKGTVVRLQVLKKGSAHETKIITLVRNKIKLQDQAAKKSVITVRRGNRTIKIGVITIPTFYLDFEALSRRDPDYRSTTRDVKALIKELKKENVAGILIDLRGNGGGSLYESTTLTGLFIRSGPVVQIKSSSGNIEMHRDDDPHVAYTGPLAVLVDRGSASASEIFAGAIQDYKRGIIIGEPTFGKGTVQKLYDLNVFRYLRANNGNRVGRSLLTGKKNKLGQLKLTVAQFFRVNGESTQHRGVLPDIRIPSLFDVSDQGESSYKNALPWARITPARYALSQSGPFSLEVLRKRHQARVKTDMGFRYFNMLARSFRQSKNQKFVTLLESQRRKERAKREKLRKLTERKMRMALGMNPGKGKNDKPGDDEETPSARILLREAANILTDFIDLRNRRQARSFVNSGKH